MLRFKPEHVSPFPAGRGRKEAVCAGGDWSLIIYIMYHKRSDCFNAALTFVTTPPP